VFIPNVTRPSATGKPGMHATALSNDGPNFHGNKMGLMFYSALHPSHAEGRTGFSLEFFTDVREHVPTVNDSTMRAEFTGPVMTEITQPCVHTCDDLFICQLYLLPDLLEEMDCKEDTPLTLHFASFLSLSRLIIVI
jgi:hypothetical protein